MPTLTSDYKKLIRTLSAIDPDVAANFQKALFEHDIDTYADLPTTAKGSPADILANDCFFWHLSPQGGEYWSNIYKKLIEMEE